MDLSSLRVSNDAVEMPIVNPSTGLPFTAENGEEMALLLVGMDHDNFTRINNEILNRRLKKTTNSRKVQITAEEVNSESLQRAAACVVGFKNITIGGEVLEFNKANVTMLLKDLPALREQVEEFIAERANFLK